MTDVRIGRLLVATLHQAISQVLPDRLEFSGDRLHGKKLRDGSIGLAPMTAVLGFLRTEGEPYHRVMAEAGRCAADWTIDSMTGVRQRVIGSLPRALRSRRAVRVARAIVGAGCSTSFATAKVSGGRVRFQVHDSLFCRVRAAQPQPLCHHHEAMVARVLQRFGLPADITSRAAAPRAAAPAS